MTEDHRLARRHVVDAVPEPFTGADGTGGEAKNFTTKPAAVRVIGDDKTDTGKQSNQQGVHENSRFAWPSAWPAVTQQQTVTARCCKEKTKRLAKQKESKKKSALPKGNAD